MNHDFYISGSGGFIGRHLWDYVFANGGWPKKADSTGVGWPFVFVNLGAYGNHSHQQDYEEMVQANILDLQSRIRLASHSTLIKFYNISTSSVTLPKQTLYSATKLVGEKIIESLNDERFVNVRPYSVYGPGEADHRFIPTVIRSLKSGEKMNLDSHATHDWIYVEDFIKAMFAGYTSIGTGIKTTNLEVVKMLEAISGKRLNYDETKLRDYDNGNWVSPVCVPHRTLFDGLKQTYESF